MMMQMVGAFAEFERTRAGLILLDTAPMPNNFHASLAR
jgi:hypothetical protein